MKTDQDSPMMSIGTEIAREVEEKYWRFAKDRSIPRPTGNAGELARNKVYSGIQSEPGEFHVGNKVWGVQDKGRPRRSLGARRDDSAEKRQEGKKVKTTTGVKIPKGF